MTKKREPSKSFNKRIHRLESGLRELDISNEDLDRANQLQGQAKYDTNLLKQAVGQYEKAFVDLFDFSNDALFLIDIETTTILRANARVTDVTGLPFKSIVGVRMGDLSDFSGHSFEQVVENITKAARDGSWNFELICKDLASNPFEAEVRLKRVDLPTGQTVMSSLFDRSSLPKLKERMLVLEQERKELDEARAMYRRLSFIASAVPQTIWACDTTGRITFCNRRFEEITGLSVSNRNKWQELIHPDDKPEFRRAWTRAMNTGSTLYFEFRMARHIKYQIRPEYRWYEVKAVASRDTNGDICEWYGIFNELNSNSR